MLGFLDRWGFVGGEIGGGIGIGGEGCGREEGLVNRELEREWIFSRSGILKS